MLACSEVICLCFGSKESQSQFLKVALLNSDKSTGRTETFLSGSILGGRNAVAEKGQVYRETSEVLEPSFLSERSCFQHKKSIGFVKSIVGAQSWSGVLSIHLSLKS